MARGRSVAPTELAEALGWLVGHVRSGELTASSATIHRIEGAIVACRVLAKGGDVDPVALVERLAGRRAEDSVGPLDS
jgi:hypothetical protein